MASSSFDVSGLSDLSSVSIDAEETLHRPAAVTRLVGRTSTSAGRVQAPVPPLGRTQTPAAQGSVSSIEISESDLSGSIIMDQSGESLGPTQRTSSSRPTTSARAPATQGRPPAQRGASRATPGSVSSFEISGSDISGSIDVGEDDGGAGPGRGTGAAATSVWGVGAGRPFASGRPPLGPGRPSAGPSTGIGAQSRWGSVTAAAPAAARGLPALGSDSYSLSISAGSDDDLLGDVDVSGGGGRDSGRATTAEVLNLDGPKVTKTHITRGALAREPVRESTHTVVLSGPESLDLDGSSLDIEYSEDAAPAARTWQQQQQRTQAQTQQQQQRPGSSLGAAAAPRPGGSRRRSSGSGRGEVLRFGGLDSGSGSGGVSLSGSIAFSEDNAPVQGRGAAARVGGAGAQTSRGAMAAVQGEDTSLSMEYDAALLRDGGVSGSTGGLGDSVSIDYGTSSQSLGGAGAVGGGVPTGLERPPSRRPPLAPGARERSRTPSLSGSSFDDTASVSVSASEHSARRAAPTSRPPYSSLPPPQHQPQYQQYRHPDSPSAGRAPGSARPSRPQSISGLTAEPAFASGTSRGSSAVSPSHSSRSGGSGRRRGGGSDGSASGSSSDGISGLHRLGETLQDASALFATASVAGVDVSHDTYGTSFGAQSDPRVGVSGGGDGYDGRSESAANSWDQSDDGTGHRGRGGGRRRSSDGDGDGGSGGDPIRSRDVTRSLGDSSAGSFGLSPRAGRAPGAGGRATGGRRVVQSGGGGGSSRSRSSHVSGPSASSDSSDGPMHGVRLRGMDELEVSDGTPGGTTSWAMGGVASSQEVAATSVEETTPGVSYDTDPLSPPPARGDTSSRPQTQLQRPQHGTWPASNGGGSGSVRSEDSAAVGGRGRAGSESIDSLLEELRPPVAAAAAGGMSRGSAGVGSGRDTVRTPSHRSSDGSSERRSSKDSAGSVGDGAGRGPAIHSHSGSASGSASPNGGSAASVHDLLAGLEMRRESSSSGGSGENILTLDQLQAVDSGGSAAVAGGVPSEEASCARVSSKSSQSRSSARSRVSSRYAPAQPSSNSEARTRAGPAPTPRAPPPPPAASISDSYSEAYDEDFVSESVATDSVAASASRALSRANSSLRADSMRRRLLTPGSGGGASEPSLRQQAAGGPRHLPVTPIAESSSGEHSSGSLGAASSEGGSSGGRRGRAKLGGGQKDGNSAATDGVGGLRPSPTGDAVAVTVPRPLPPSQQQHQLKPMSRTGSAAGPFPDPRVALGVARSGSYSYSSVEEDDEALMVAAVRLRQGRAGRPGEVSWPQLSETPSEHSSPSFSRGDISHPGLQLHHHHPPDLDASAASPSGTLDASASHLSQSGALGTSPVRSVWATFPAGSPGGRGDKAGNRDVGDGGGADPYGYSRDSDLSEEYIPAQGMQRALQEQPIFRPLMPNVPTPRASTGATGAVPAFTSRGGTPSPPPGATGSSPATIIAGGPHSPPYYPRPQQSQPQTQPSQQQRPQHRQSEQPLSPEVAAAAAPPPSKQECVATRTDVYSNVVDLDPIPRPGTVKLRTVGMQWGTLNEVATQVAFDPVGQRLVEAGAIPGPGEGAPDPQAPLPPHLRHQLQHHLLQQQQLYGPFTKRTGGGGWPSSLLQAGADAVLGDATPLSGIGPGFGILSLAFHSVKTAAMLEQLERSLSSAATAAAASAAQPPPPAGYPPHAISPYGYGYGYPYGMAPPGWWPTAPAPAAGGTAPVQSPGQAAAAAYAAATSAAAQQPPPQPPAPVSPGGTAVTAGAVCGGGGGGGTARPGSPMVASPSPSRLRAVSLSSVLTPVATAAATAAATPAAATPPPTLRLSLAGGNSSISVGGAGGVSVSGVFGEASTPIGGGAGAAVAAVASRRSLISSVGSGRGLSFRAAREPSSSSVLRHGRSSGGVAGGSSGDYSEDFEEIEEEEEEVEEEGIEDVPGVGRKSGSSTGGGGVVATESSVSEEEVLEESIAEESLHGGSGSGGGGKGSGAATGSSSTEYSEDFDAESIPALSQSRVLQRSATVGSTSRRTLNPLMSGNSFSGRSLLRRGSVLVTTLAPISGSDPASREDDDDLPSQGSRVFNRVGSIIKSSSGFKRTASLSITMADDPMLPNQMARILPAHINTSAGGSGSAGGGGGGLAAQPSSRRLSVDETSRSQHAAVSAGVGGSGHGPAEQQRPPQPTGQQAAPVGEAAGTPPAAYPPLPPYYPYPYPYPYAPYAAPPPPYGMPYPPPPAAAAPPPAHLSAAAVLQYLPPPIPVPSGMYFYPPYPAGPTSFASATGGAPPPHAAYATGHGPAGPAAGAPAIEGGLSAAAARAHGSLLAPGHPHHHHLHGNHVKFADGSGPGTEVQTAGARAAVGTAGASGPGTASPLPQSGVPPVPFLQVQQQQQQQQQQQHPAGGAGYVSQGPGAYGSLLGLGGGGIGVGGSPLFTTQSTLQRFGSVLGSGAYPGLDPATLRTIRRDLVNTAAAVSGQIGYEDIVAEQGAADEYRSQLARVRARLAAARASLPCVIPSQDKEVLLRTTITATTASGGMPTTAVAAGAAGSGGVGVGLGAGGVVGGSRVLGVSLPAPGSYRYTTLEDTRRLIEATRPYTTVGVN